MGNVEMEKQKTEGFALRFGYCFKNEEFSIP